MKASKQDIKTLTILKKRSDFVKLNKKGRRWVSHGLVVQVIKNDLDQKRVGYTVTKRTNKSAVHRNRIKRRLRSIAAEILPSHAQNAHDYVLIGRQLTETRPYDQLCKDLKWCLKKLECIEP